MGKKISENIPIIIWRSAWMLIKILLSCINPMHVTFNIIHSSHPPIVSILTHNSQLTDTPHNNNRIFSKIICTLHVINLRILHIRRAGQEWSKAAIGDRQEWKEEEKKQTQTPVSVFQLDQFMSGQQHWNKIIRKKKGDRIQAIGALGTQAHKQKVLKIYMHTHVWPAVFNV